MCADASRSLSIQVYVYGRKERKDRKGGGSGKERDCQIQEEARITKLRNVREERAELTDGRSGSCLSSEALQNFSITSALPSRSRKVAGGQRG